MKIQSKSISSLLLVSIAIFATSAAVAEKIEFIEGHTGNNYFKYPIICKVEKHTTVEKYGFDTFCGVNNNYSEYIVQYKSNYGDNYGKKVDTGKTHFHKVGTLPGDDPFVASEFVITPVIHN